MKLREDKRPFRSRRSALGRTDGRDGRRNNYDDLNNFFVETRFFWWLFGCTWLRPPGHSTQRFHVALPTLTMPPKPSTRSSATHPNAFHSLWRAYSDNTTDRLKFIDAFLFFLMLSGIVQFAYCVLVSNFPYNAFLAGYVYHLTRLG